MEMFNAGGVRSTDAAAVEASQPRIAEYFSLMTAFYQRRLVVQLVSTLHRPCELFYLYKVRRLFQLQQILGSIPGSQVEYARCEKCCLGWVSAS
jgi:hypothetical protein